MTSSYMKTSNSNSLYYDLLPILRISQEIPLQARNQEFFWAEFSWSQGALINNQVQHEKERPCREKSPVFPPGNSSELRFK